MTDWYVRPAGGSYGAEDGTSYTDAWDGFANVVWGAGGVVAGDVLHLDDSFTGEQLVVAADGTTISGGEISAENIFVSGYDDVTVSGLLVSGYATAGGLDFRTCVNLSVDKVTATGCDFGLNMQSLTSGHVNAEIVSNDTTGAKIQGDTEGLVVSGVFTDNGNGATGDRDGISLGHSGGTMTGVIIRDSIIDRNGPRSGTDNDGSGVIASTANPFACELDVLRNTLDNNWRQALLLGEDWTGGAVTGNVVSNTIGPGLRGGIHIIVSGLTKTSSACQNTIVDGTGTYAGIRIFAATGGSSLLVKNNIVANNNNASYEADLNLQVADSDRAVSHNCLYSPAANDLVKEGANTYTTASAWDAANGGGGHLDVDPVFVSATDYRLDGDSPCIGAGATWWTGEPPHGQDGLRFCSPPSMGAYEVRPHRSGYPRRAGVIPARVLPAGVDIAKAKTA